jgi:murein DD-endopeptidase MepM/ murein hydrolase activator NlpD
MRIGESPRWSKVQLLISAAAAVLLSACSTSVDRFSQNASPADADPVYTASVPPEDDGSEVIARSEEEEVAAKPLAKARIKSKSRDQDYADNSGYAQPRYGKKKGYAEESAEAAVYKRPLKKKAVPAVETAEIEEPTVEPAAADETPVATRKPGGVRVEEGMTLYSIARANGLPVAKVAAANGIEAPYGVSVGQIIKIPGVARPKVPQVALKVRPPAEEAEPADVAVAEPADEPEAQPIKIKKPLGKQASLHTVKTGDTLFSLGRKYGVHPYSIASLNSLEKDSTLTLGQQVRIPAGGKPAVIADADDAAPDEAAAPVKRPVKKGKQKIAEKVPEAAGEEAEAETETEVAPAPKKSLKQVADAGEEIAPPAAVNVSPGFRWPVKGKVISGYGPKANGLRNEGINLAVPEGTSVRAAESGVVAYAGNELKGYGNLVLVRHEGGWVTAYAHAKELFVKRGDTVKRGDVIAKAGQTGSVTSPQLHFEIRKGATAMDPIRFLNAATAAN